jgi:hypothetical protein
VVWPSIASRLIRAKSPETTEPRCEVALHPRLAVATLLGAVAITVAAPTIVHAGYSVRTLD